MSTPKPQPYSILIDEAMMRPPRDWWSGLKRLYRRVRFLRKTYLWRISRGYFYQIDVQANDPARTDQAENLPQMTPMTREKIAATAGWTALEMREIERRLNAGDTCYGISDDGCPAHLVWVHRGPVYCRGGDFVLNTSESDWYVYGVMTKPSHRGRGLYKSKGVCLLAKARELGIRRLIHYVEADNPIPQRVLPKLGYQQSPRYTSFRIAGLRFGYALDGVGSAIRRKLWVSMPKGVLWI